MISKRQNNRNNYNLAYERIVIASIIRSIQLLPRIAGILKPDYFYSKVNQLIFRTIMSMDTQNKTVSVVTIGDSLKNDGDFEKAGGKDYLEKLVERSIDNTQLSICVYSIQKLAFTRKLIPILSGLESQCLDTEQNIFDILSTAEYEIGEIKHRFQFRQYHHIKDIIYLSLNRLEKTSEDFYKSSYIPAKSSSFNRILLKLKPSELSFVSSEDSERKTASILNIAIKAALNSQKKGAILVFSNEYGKEQIGMRFLSQLSRIKYISLQTGNLSESNWDALASAIDKISPTPIFINDGDNDIHKIVNISKQLDDEFENGVSLILVDNFHLLNKAGKHPTKKYEYSYIANCLNCLAQKLLVPVIAMVLLEASSEKLRNDRSTWMDSKDLKVLKEIADKNNNVTCKKETMKKPNVKKIDLRLVYSNGQSI